MDTKYLIICIDEVQYYQGVVDIYNQKPIFILDLGLMSISRLSLLKLSFLPKKVNQKKSENKRAKIWQPNLVP